MNQPVFADGPPVPLMVEGLIDATTLRQLFADLAAHASVIGVREKSDPREYTVPESLSASLALDRLLSGSAQAIQVRYRHDGHEWTDTILATPGGFRVIRCSHET